MDSFISPGSCAAIALVPVHSQCYLVAAGVDAGHQKLPGVHADQWHAGQCSPAWYRLSFPGALFSVVAWFISADYAAPDALPFFRVEAGRAPGLAAHLFARQFQRSFFEQPSANEADGYSESAPIECVVPTVAS